MTQGGPDDKALLAVVDRSGASEERLEIADLESVGVRTACDFPQSQSGRIILSGRVVPEMPQDVGLGLHEDHRDIEIVADSHGGCAQSGDEIDGPARFPQRHGGTCPAVDDKPVDETVMRLDAVRIRGHGQRGLGLTDRQNPLDVEVGQRGRRAVSQGVDDLREDRIAVPVAGVLQAAVPLRVGTDQALGRAITDGHRRRTALNAGELRRHPHPGVSAPDDLLAQIGVVGGRVLSAADVQPLHHQRAVEALGVGGRSRDHAGDELGVVDRLDVETAIGRQVGGGVPRRHPRHRVFTLVIPGAGQVGTGHRRHERQTGTPAEHRELGAHQTTFL